MIICEMNPGLNQSGVLFCANKFEKHCVKP